VEIVLVIAIIVIIGIANAVFDGLFELILYWIWPLLLTVFIFFIAIYNDCYNERFNIFLICFGISLQFIWIFRILRKKGDYHKVD